MFYGAYGNGLETIDFHRKVIDGGLPVIGLSTGIVSLPSKGGEKAARAMETKGNVLTK